MPLVESAMAMVERAMVELGLVGLMLVRQWAKKEVEFRVSEAG